LKRKTLLLGSGAAGLALLAADQVVQHTVLRDGLLGGHLVAPFDPPLFSPGQREYVQRLQRDLGRREGGAFDPDLGWCPKPDSGSGAMRYDWAAARIGFEPLRREKEAGLRRVVAVGCSFTRCDEVGGEEAWPALVDRALETWEIANLGVGGYGLDQALLRLERDGPGLAPDEVWLGYLPMASARVTTVYMPAMSHWFAFPAFKPRFRLDGEERLVLVPNPVRSLEELLRALTDQEVFVRSTRDDLRVSEARIAYAPEGSHWMHAFASTRLLLTYHEGKLERDAAADVQDPTGETHRLLRAIALRARDAAERCKARFRFLVLPASWDLRRREEQGRAYWEGLAEALRAQGVEVLDLSDALVEAAALEREDFWMPGYHYAVAGNRAVAEAVLSTLSLER
jgi:hypothetical protein